MTRQDARDLLDAARDGADISTRLITEALQSTGDIEPQILDDLQNINFKPAGTWEMRSRGLAAAQWFESIA